MTASTATKWKLKDARQALGLTVKQLAESSGVSVQTIYRIEGGISTEYATRTEVGELLAEQLALSVDEIDWPRGLSNTGRLPLTGKSITPRSGPVNIIQRFCPDPGCNSVMPVGGDICSVCGNAP